MKGISFKHEENQKVWDGFYSRFLERYTGKGDPRTSVNQYKPIMLVLESIVGDNFSNMTIKHWEEAEQAKDNRANFLRSVLMDGVVNGDLTLDKRVMIAILPEQYKAFVAKIFE